MPTDQSCRQKETAVVAVVSKKSQCRTEKRVPASRVDRSSGRTEKRVFASHSSGRTEKRVPASRVDRNSGARISGVFCQHKLGGKTAVMKGWPVDQVGRHAVSTVIVRISFAHCVCVSVCGHKGTRL